MKIHSLFRRLFRHPLLRSGTWMVGSGTVTAGSGFATNLVLVRFISPEEFGQFAVVLSIIGMIATYLNLQIEDLIIQIKEEELTERRVDTVLSASIFQSTIIGVLGIGVLEISGQLNLLASLVLVAQGVSPIVGGQRSLYERDFEYGKLSILEGSSKVVGHLFAIVGVFSGLGAAVLYIRPAVIKIGKVLGLGAVGGLRSFYPRWLSLSEWRSLINEVRGLWTDAILNQSYGRFLIILTRTFAGETSTGLFFQARKLARSAPRLAQPLSFKVLFNYLARHVPEQRAFRALLKMLSLEALGLIAAATVVIGWADPIVPILFGTEWSPVVPLFRAMGGVFVTGTFLASIQAYFMARNHMRSYIIFGHGARYAGLSISVGILVLFNTEPALTLAVGYSGAFVAAFVASLGAAAIISTGRKITSV